MNYSKQGVVVDILHLHKKGLSYRSIARMTGTDRRTIKRYVERPELFREPRTLPARQSKLDSFKERIDTWLQEDPQLRATWIYDHLEGYDGGMTILREYVSRAKAEKRRVAYLRFETEPGLQAQVDFGEFLLEMPGGRIVKFYMFAMILGYSRMLYAEFLPKCDMTHFLEAHLRAFSYFGGVPAEIIYDRMRNVLIRKIAGVTRFTQGLSTVAAHYLFKPEVTPAYSPWVKGKIERPYDFIREGFWRGYGFSDLQTANRDLMNWLERKAERVHGTVHEKVSDRFNKEKAFLNPLPVMDCDISERLTRKVWKDLVIHVDCNRYVVPDKSMALKKVLVRLKDDSLRIYDDNRLIASYPVPEGKGQLIGAEYYNTLRSEREMNARKYIAPPRKGRARLSTISPALNRHQVDVQIRSLNVYEQIGGEVAYG